MPTRRTQQIALEAGGGYDGTLVLPEAGHGPGIVLLQEIFGVGDFLLGKADDLASLGYVVLCPDVFWRVEPHVALAHDDAALATGMSLAGRYAAEIPEPTRVADLVAAETCLRGLDEVTGRVGVLGYCLGGHLAFLVAVHGSPDACVAYYGSGIGDRLGDAPRVSCPILLHYGGSDPYISGEEIEAVATAFAARRDAEVRIEPGAGHAFENLVAPAFADPDASSRSWPATVAFLKDHLG